jgi:hypothetical protein
MVDKDLRFLHTEVQRPAMKKQLRQFVAFCGMIV